MIDGIETVLAVEDLSVDYRTEAGPLHALRNVSLEVPQGMIVGIVGESGCGKSTLIAAIMRLLAPNASVVGGQVRVAGQSLLDLDDSTMRKLRGDRLSVVFQDPMTTFNPVLNIGTQMIDAQHRKQMSKEEKRQRAADMLSLVGIPDAASRLNDFPHQFSGGMRQRIAIAMALQAEPDLLIADEPTTALDATLEVQIIHLLKELQRRIGCSILFISHHLGVVAELCDRVVVMYAGEVVERGSARQIFKSARHPYTQKLLSCDPAQLETPTRHLPSIPGELPNLVQLPQGCIFEARCPRADQVCRASPPLSDSVAEQHDVRCFHFEDQSG
ncbi:MAG: ABC transporter ATP-binding protein [bacterium]|nr:ABC transporter ATP-binding protein [bacterium]